MFFRNSFLIHKWTCGTKTNITKDKDVNLDLFARVDKSQDNRRNTGHVTYIIFAMSLKIIILVTLLASQFVRRRKK